MPLRIRSHIEYPVAPVQEPVSHKHVHRTFRPWSAKDDQIVRRFYKAHGSRAVGEMLGRDFKLVQNRARRLGISEPR